MAAGDLNLLKSWNPKLMKNRKKVWETEQDLLKEESKLKERQKELEKERELNNLRDTSKNTTKRTGLEWMYDDRIGKDENEDYLLGRKKLDTKVIKVQNNNDTKDTHEVQSSKKIYDYSNDDPMSKFQKAAKLNKNKKIKLSKNRITKNTNKSIQKSTVDY